MNNKSLYIGMSNLPGTCDDEWIDETAPLLYDNAMELFQSIEPSHFSDTLAKLSDQAEEDDWQELENYGGPQIDEDVTDILRRKLERKALYNCEIENFKAARKYNNVLNKVTWIVVYKIAESVEAHLQKCAYTRIEHLSDSDRQILTDLTSKYWDDILTPEDVKVLWDRFDPTELKESLLLLDLCSEGVAHSIANEVEDRYINPEDYIESIC